MNDCTCMAGTPLIGPGVLHEIGCADSRARALAAYKAKIADRERDAANFRAELRDRLDRCTDHDHGLAFGWLADNHPDLVREALDETGAPE